MSHAAPANRRRDKPILSCSFCRTRKLRCDRESPCGACTKRGRPAECFYSSTPQERREAVDYRPLARSQHARQRIHHLEAVVTQLRDQMSSMEQGGGSGRGGSGAGAACSTAPDAASAGPSTTDSKIVDSMGNLNLGENHAVYTGSTHWVTILEDIQSLKDEIGSSPEDDANESSPGGSTPFDEDPTTLPPVSRISLLSSLPALPKHEILSMVPSRTLVDRYISHFFNAFDFASSILHRDTFLAEYARFWESPAATQITWIGLLFSIMTVSAWLQQEDTDTHSQYAAELQSTLETYRTLTIHCLVAGNYLRPSKYTVETLTLHFAVDQNTNVDTNIGNWMLIGVVIRVALRMGLHRDPSHWPNIRPLEAEYRRRLWITLYLMDFFTSTQVGLPRIVKDSQCDTRLPRNLLNEDLSAEMETAPPERPLTQTTPLSFVIQRFPIIKVAAEIYDATEAGPPTNAVIAELAGKLEAAVESIPEQTKYRPLDSLVAESPTNILQRIAMDILVQKATYLLYRRSFMKGKMNDSASAEANRLCINAALAILEHQRKLYDESQPGGIFSALRWRVSSSMNHEFLQATIMLCFALNRFRRGGNKASMGSYTLHRQQDIIDALRLAQGLWERISNQSAEARRAAAAIESVLKQERTYSLATTYSGTASSTSETTPNSWRDAGGFNAAIDTAPGLAVTNTTGLQGFTPGSNAFTDFSTDSSGFTSDVDMTIYADMWDDLLSDPALQNPATTF